MKNPIAKSTPGFLGRNRAKIFGISLGVILTLGLFALIGRRKTTPELGADREETDTFYPAV